MMMSDHWVNLEDIQSLMSPLLVFKNTKQFRLLHRSWASPILVGSKSMKETNAVSRKKKSDAKSRGKYNYFSLKRIEVITWHVNTT